MKTIYQKSILVKMLKENEVVQVQFKIDGIEDMVDNLSDSQHNYLMMLNYYKKNKKLRDVLLSLKLQPNEI